MSVRIMTLVFDYEFPQRIEYEALVYPFKRDGETWKITEVAAEPVIRKLATTGSSCNGILLCLSDHANDDGKGAYPSVKTLMRKSNLTRPTVISAILALQYHLFINFVGLSPYETNNYDINVGRLVKPFDGGGKLALPVKVNPLYRGGKLALPEPSFNHPLTSKEEEEEKRPEIFIVYENEIGPLTPSIADKLIEAETVHTGHWVCEALKIASGNGKRNWAYVDSILTRWKAEGYGSEYKAQEKQYGHQKRNSKGSASAAGKTESYSPSEADIALAEKIKRQKAERREHADV